MLLFRFSGLFINFLNIQENVALTFKNFYFYRNQRVKILNAWTKNVITNVNKPSAPLTAVLLVILNWNQCQNLRLQFSFLISFIFMSRSYSFSYFIQTQMLHIFFFFIGIMTNVWILSLPFFLYDSYHFSKW